MIFVYDDIIATQSYLRLYYASAMRLV